MVETVEQEKLIYGENPPDCWLRTQEFNICRQYPEQSFRREVAAYVLHARPCNARLSSVQIPLYIAPMSSLPKVLLAGGPDIDARLDLMRRLNGDFDISAIGSSPTLYERFQAEGFEYHTYRLSRKANPFLDLLMVAQVVFMLRKFEPQIVHTFDSKPGVWVRLAARLAGVPVIVGTLPGLGSLYASNGLKTRLIRFVYERLQTFACSISDLTIFQNHDDAHHFVASGMVSQEKTAVILGSGVATGLYAPAEISKSERDQLRFELGIQPDEIVVAMVGRVIRSKGVLEYMTAAQEVRALHPNAKFLLVGADDHESLDRLSAEELTQLRQALTWPGPRRDIPVLLASSDIFVLPSYREGVPRVLLEAASMGLPIVTTDSPGCREVVENGLNGFLVPVRDASALRDAIFRLVEQPELRRRFGRLSRQRAIAQFDIAIVAEQTRSLYRELWASKAQLMATEP